MSEFDLIARIRELLEPARGWVGAGDDTAVLPRFRGRTLATCDALVEGVHFRAEDGPWEDVGWKALAVNLSDVAAMGGRPRFALVSLGIPAHASTGDVLAVYRGMLELAAEAGVAVAGGNVTRSPALWIDVTLLGEAPPRPVLRNGARPGDAVLVTGALGAAAAGLALLDRRREGLSLPAEPAQERLEEAIRAQRRPRPRLAAGAALAAAGLATAMIDVSDGLAADLGHIAEASSVGIELDAGRIPVAEAARAVAGALGVSALEWALHGGEDYELAFTVPPARVREAVEAVRAGGVACTPIGRVVAERGLWLKENGRPRQRLTARGWDHLDRRNPSP